MMKTQKIYNIIAISLVYFFLEMTLYRGAKLIGIQEYWISEYSCAVTPQIRQTGNRLSGNAGTAYASLLA